MEQEHEDLEDIISKVVEQRDEVDRRREPREKAFSYILGVVLIASIAMICIVLVSIFSPASKDVIIIISALVGTVIPNVITILKSNENGNHTKQLRTALNGRLKEFIIMHRREAEELGKRSPRTPRAGQGEDNGTI